MPSSIKSLALSEDGNAVRITLDSGNVDIVSSEIGSLVMLLSQAEQLRIQKTQQNTNWKVTHAITQWELGTPNHTDLILSLCNRGGLEMSFRMNRTDSIGILEALCVALGLAIPDTTQDRH